jgi:hypothetical protein
MTDPVPEPEQDFDPDTTQMLKKVKKYKMSNKLLLKLKRQDFRNFVVFGKLLNIVGIRSRNQNQNFSKVGTGTATNHYGSTTLALLLPFAFTSLLDMSLKFSNGS